MHLHRPTEENDMYQNSKEVGGSGTRIFDLDYSLNYLRPGMDVPLQFVKTERPVSAAQYVCWHRIIQGQLSCNTDERDTMMEKFEVAYKCLRGVATVHSLSQGRYCPSNRGWWLEYTPVEMRLLQKLKNDAINIRLKFALEKLREIEMASSNGGAEVLAICMILLVMLIICGLFGVK